jgi:hypothetical protein
VSKQDNSSISHVVDVVGELPQLFELIVDGLRVPGIVVIHGTS